jgi:hypothetical protein
MKITKKVTWKLGNGKAAGCRIEVMRMMVDDTVDADSWKIITKPVELLNITVALGSKFVAHSPTTPSIIATPTYSKEYVDKITSAGGYARVGDAVISREAYDKIMAALAEAVAEAEQDPEYAAYKAQQDAKEVASADTDAEARRAHHLYEL